MVDHEGSFTPTPGTGFPKTSLTKLLIWCGLKERKQVADSPITKHIGNKDADNEYDDGDRYQIRKIQDQRPAWMAQTNLNANDARSGGSTETASHRVFGKRIVFTECEITVTY